MNPLANIPKKLHKEIEQLWESQVKGGRRRYVKKNDVSGRTGQWKISRLLKSAGINKSDTRWDAVINHGRDLYFR